MNCYGLTCDGAHCLQLLVDRFDDVARQSAVRAVAVHEAAQVLEDAVQDVRRGARAARQRLDEVSKRKMIVSLGAALDDGRVFEGVLFIKTK